MHSFTLFTFHLMTHKRPHPTPPPLPHHTLPTPSRPSPASPLPAPSCEGLLLQDNAVSAEIRALLSSYYNDRWSNAHLLPVPWLCTPTSLPVTGPTTCNCDVKMVTPPLSWCVEFFLMQSFYALRRCYMFKGVEGRLTLHFLTYSWFD